MLLAPAGTNPGGPQTLSSFWYPDLHTPPSHIHTLRNTTLTPVTSLRHSVHPLAANPYSPVTSHSHVTLAPPHRHSASPVTGLNHTIHRELAPGHPDLPRLLVSGHVSPPDLQSHSRCWHFRVPSTPASPTAGTTTDIRTPLSHGPKLPPLRPPYTQNGDTPPRPP